MSVGTRMRRMGCVFMVASVFNLNPHPGIRRDCAHPALVTGGLAVFVARRYRYIGGVMSVFKRILVPTDLSESSRIELDYSLLFADALGADLTLFYADPMHFEFDLLTGAPVYVSGINAEERILLEKDVRTYADKSLRARPYRVVIGAGDPVATIAREARDASMDLIIMATHGQRGWRRTALGSVTEGVVHEAPCPVL